MSRRGLLTFRFFTDVIDEQPEPRVEVPAPAPERTFWLDARPSEQPVGPQEGLEARLLMFECLCYFGSTCTTCVERCPEPGAIVMEAGKPQFVSDKCTGCGVCADMCPAPGRAIVMAPRTLREG